MSEEISDHRLSGVTRISFGMLEVLYGGFIADILLARIEDISVLIDQVAPRLLVLWVAPMFSEPIGDFVIEKFHPDNSYESIIMVEGLVSHSQHG